MATARDAKAWAREHLRGLYVSPLTIFHDDDSLDEEGLAFNVDHLVRLGVTGLGYGHGEPWSLSHDRITSGSMSGLSPGAPSASPETSMTAAGPISCRSGTRSTETSPAGPASGSPEDGGGMKCVGASKCVPVCSSIRSQRVW